MARVSVLLTNSVLGVQAIERSVEDPAAGAAVSFVGQVRNKHAGLDVLRLEYSAQENLARKCMEKLGLAAMEQFKLTAVCIHHRLGVLEIGEAAVVIAVSAAHRGAAFDGCRYLIDTLKTDVPIWKKEYYTDGRTPVWVGPDGKPIV